MFDLFVLYICSLFITMSTIGHGFFFKKIANLNLNSNNLGLTGIFGLFFLSILSSYSHLFFAHNYLHNILIIFLVYFFYFFILKN